MYDGLMLKLKLKFEIIIKTISSYYLSRTEQALFFAPPSPSRTPMRSFQNNSYVGFKYFNKYSVTSTYSVQYAIQPNIIYYRIRHKNLRYLKQSVTFQVFTLIFLSIHHVHCIGKRHSFVVNTIISYCLNYVFVAEKKSTFFQPIQT